MVVRRSRPYLFRLVVPRRDYGRVRWVEEVIRAGRATLVELKVHVLFKERSDLDAIEIVFIAKMTPEDRRRLERRLAESLRGSIGFFVSHPARTSPRGRA